MAEPRQITIVDESTTERAELLSTATMYEIKQAVNRLTPPKAVKIRIHPNHNTRGYRAVIEYTDGSSSAIGQHLPQKGWPWHINFYESPEAAKRWLADYELPFEVYSYFDQNDIGTG